MISIRIYDFTNEERLERSDLQDWFQHVNRILIDHGREEASKRLVCVMLKEPWSRNTPPGESVIRTLRVFSESPADFEESMAIAEILHKEIPEATIEIHVPQWLFQKEDTYKG